MRTGTRIDLRGQQGGVIEAAMQGCQCHGAGLMRHSSGFKDLNLGLEVLDVGNRGTSLTRKNPLKTLQ